MLAADCCLVDSMVWIPFEWDDVSALKRRLTVQPRAFGDNERPAPIHYYVEDRKRQAIGVPINFGLKRVSELGRLAQTSYYVSDGFPIFPPKRPDPHHIDAPEGQAEFMSEMIARLEEFKTILVKGDTGVGKTVCALNTIAHFGRTAAVVVPTKDLANQWHKRAKQHLGLEDKDLGRLEEGVCDFQGKSLVTVVVHNLANRHWPEDFYEYFGIVIYDEIHTIAARTFSQAFTRFPTKYKCAMSATPERKDGTGIIITDHFGEPAVVGGMDAQPMTMLTARYHGKRCGGPRAVVISRLGEDQDRNAFLTGIIETCFKNNRQMMIISDRIAQLQWLMWHCNQRGITQEHIGMFAGSFTVDGKSYTFKADELARQEQKQLVFTTYGMMKEGKDIPRLDSGLDATPRASGIQVIGRARRKGQGKPRSLWITPYDTNTPVAVQLYHARMRDIRQSKTVTFGDYTQQQLQEHGFRTF